MRPFALVVSAGLAALAAFVVQPAAAQARDGVFAVAGRGAPGWTVSCALERVGEPARTQEMTGRRVRERQVLAVRRVVSGTCAYAAAADGALTLEVTDRAFACPFEEAAEGVCRRVVPAGQKGEFVVTLKGV